MAEIIYTAKFNQNIEAPNTGGGDNNSYDLNTIITTTGFEGKVQYELLNGNNVTITDNTLTINDGAYGIVSINVTYDKQSAIAETEIYGFYAKVNENRETLKKEYDTAHIVYSEIVPKTENIVEPGVPRAPEKLTYSMRLPK